MLKKICLCLCVVALCACVQQNSATSQVSTKSVATATPSFALKKASNKHVYVYVSKSATMADVAVRQALEASLGTQGFTVTPTPSEAGYIIYITPVYAGAMKQNIAVGEYGTPWKSGGAQADGVGIVVDVHVVSRKIATSSRYNMVAITAATPSVLSKKMLRMMAFDKESQLDATHKTQLLQELVGRIALAMR